jgi:hypothetical protein
MAARGLFFTPQLGTGADPAWGQVGLEPPPLQFLAMNEEEEEEKVKKKEGKKRKKEEDGKLSPLYFNSRSATAACRSSHPCSFINTVTNGGLA